MKINEGWSAKKMHEARERFKGQIEEENRKRDMRTGGWCIFWFIILVIILSSYAACNLSGAC
jgi:hypothetical protein